MMLINVRLVNKKTHLIHDEIVDGDIDIVCMTETCQSVSSLPTKF